MAAVDDEPAYKPGHPPHDRINGLRVGGLAGAIVGIVIAVAFDGPFWVVPGAAAFGAGYGFLSEWLRSRI